MKKTLMIGTAALLCLAGTATIANAAADSGRKDSKISQALERIYRQNETAKAAGGDASSANRSAKARLKRVGEDRPASDANNNGNTLYLGNISSDGYVSIDAVAANVTSDLEVSMKAMGARNVSSRGRTVSAQFPADRLMELNASQYLAFARPVLATTNVGLVTSQGDRSMRTDVVRSNFGFTGAGLTIGVLSDSFACDPGTLAGGPYTSPAEDVANGDLPANLNIISDFTDINNCTDEGRGMA